MHSHSLQFILFFISYRHSGIVNAWSIYNSQYYYHRKACVIVAHYTDIVTIILLAIVTNSRELPGIMATNCNNTEQYNPYCAAIIPLSIIFVPGYCHNIYLASLHNIICTIYSPRPITIHCIYDTSICLCTALANAQAMKCKMIMFAENKPCKLLVDCDAIPSQELRWAKWNL